MSGTAITEKHSICSRSHKVSQINNVSEHLFSRERIPWIRFEFNDFLYSMTCTVRYLNSSGIMPREIVGIDALHHALPAKWLLYASLNCYPRNQDPMEIDVLVVTENCVLILELKDWNGKLTNRGDLWFINGKSRGRSAVIAANEKAKKLKTVLASELPAIAARIRVESRVVLTATATKAKLSDAEKPYVWTLAEACAIADPLRKSQLLPVWTKLGLFKLHSFSADFERVFGNSRLFQAADAEWAGYRISDQNIFVHPRNLWVEHKAEKKSDSRIKGLIRVWSFASLPP